MGCLYSPVIDGFGHSFNATSIVCRINGNQFLGQTVEQLDLVLELVQFRVEGLQCNGEGEMNQKVNSLNLPISSRLNSIHLLLLLLGIQYIRRDSNRSHAFGTILHAVEPCFDFKSLRFVTGMSSGNF